MTPTTVNRSYYPALDGLRGLAIVLVLCCHNLRFIPYFNLGWVGVDLFFVLSGFLITDILLKTKDNKSFLSNFYIRRILKIFPLYYGALLLFFLIAPFLQNLQIQYNYYHSNQAMSWFHLQNWLYIFHQKPADSFLLSHFWSLAVEEQFYMLWPLTILAIKNIKWLARIACIILAICIAGRFISWLYFGNGYTNFNFQYMTRLDGLCIGSLIAIWRFNSYGETGKKLFRLVSILLGIHLAAFVVAKKVLPSLPHFPFFGYSSIAAIQGIIVYLAIEKRNAFSKWLIENPLLKYMGKISYGLYVYHLPILVLFKIYLTDNLVSYGYTRYTANVILSIAGLIVAIALSIVSYHFFEKKILALKDVITESGFFTRAKKKLLLLLKPATPVR
jgi:peptidoglycan/LPS O-acetylase OafA/YrhL